MQRITPEMALEISRQCGRESYFASPFWLAATCLFEKQGDEFLIYLEYPVEDKIYLQFTPKKIEPNYDILFGWKEDVIDLKKKSINIKEKILFGHEYIYDCKKLAASEGPEFRKFRQNANYFKNHYSYSILYDYPSEKVKAFIKEWASKKDLSSYSEVGKKTFWWDVGLCLSYPDYNHLPQKNLYIEIEGKLAGFAFTHPLTKNMFVGLMQKVDIQYRGLANFLYQEKAKLYPGIPYFTIGTAEAAPGLESFKDSMRPAKKIETFTLKIN